MDALQTEDYPSLDEAYQTICLTVMTGLILFSMFTLRRSLKRAFFTQMWRADEEELNMLKMKTVEIECTF